MTGGDREVWERVVQAQQPTPVELARTELELQAIQDQGVEPMARAEIDRLLARVRGRAMDRAPRRRRRRAALAAAAVTLLSLVGIAMYESDVVWPKAPSALRTLDVERATAGLADADDDRWSAGFAFLHGVCMEGLQALLRLQESADDELAAAADDACQRIAYGEPCPPSGSDAEMHPAIVEVYDPKAPTARRVAALGRVEEIVSSSIAVMRDAPAESPRRQAIKTAFVSRLEAEIEAVRLAAPPSTSAAGSGSRPR